MPLRRHPQHLCHRPKDLIGERWQPDWETHNREARGQKRSVAQRPPEKRSAIWGGVVIHRCQACRMGNLGNDASQHNENQGVSSSVT